MHDLAQQIRALYERHALQWDAARRHQPVFESVWLDRLQKHGIPCAPVHTFSGALHDPHVLDRNMVVEVSHPHGTKTRQIGNPIKLSDYPQEEYQAPPLLGQHTCEVLRNLLQLDDKTLANLQQEGVIA